MSRRRRIVPTGSSLVLPFPLARAKDLAKAYVFAYGSNTRIVQMVRRCPSAVLIDTAELRGFELAFVGHSVTWGGAVATVEPARGESIDGIIYRVTVDDLERLDAYEGAPHVYGREQMKVVGPKMTWRAWVYRHRAALPGPPSYRYLAAIVEGRVKAGLDAEPVVRAAENGLNFAPR